MSARRMLVLVGGLILTLAAPASAAQVEKIAGGLDSPRHLAFGSMTSTWQRPAAAARGRVSQAEGAVCGGATGAVTVIDEHGQHRLVEGLASFAAQGTGSAIGPHGIFVKRNNKVLITNGGPTEANRDSSSPEPVHGPRRPRPADQAQRRRREARGRLGVRARQRPGRQEPGVDSNPVDVLVDGKRLIVADAGGNTLLKAQEGRRRGAERVPDRPYPTPSARTRSPCRPCRRGSSRARTATTT